MNATVFSYGGAGTTSEKVAARYPRCRTSSTCFRKFLGSDREARRPGGADVRGSRARARPSWRERAWSTGSGRVLEPPCDERAKALECPVHVLAHPLRPRQQDRSSERAGRPCSRASTPRPASSAAPSRGRGRAVRSTPAPGCPRRPARGSRSRSVRAGGASAARRSSSASAGDRRAATCPCLRLPSRPRPLRRPSSREEVPGPEVTVAEADRDVSKLRFDSLRQLARDAARLRSSPLTRPAPPVPPASRSSVRALVAVKSCARKSTQSSRSGGVILLSTRRPGTRRSNDQRARPTQPSSMIRGIRSLITGSRSGAPSAASAAHCASMSRGACADRGSEHGVLCEGDQGARPDGRRSTAGDCRRGRRPPRRTRRRAPSARAGAGVPARARRQAASR